ncbi:response regulator transcription factor [Nocardia stercoris]|uniref:DNA-binding response regulator n=1 Tax=Nocardia stercoris TaxID=2483361 RepID=A0A3M2L8Z3_9NOCA|nr:response regulator transcription factor [Nocardia stercoris]RMI33536.1 DNA-binding response regulator [Nocardia stercoris]
MSSPDRAVPRVLLVEDDRTLADLVSTLLQEESYQVRLAVDGQLGLHRGLTERFDVLIIDRGLPVLDGLDLLRALRAHGVDTPALLLTALGAVADRVEGLDSGAEDYLVKPFEVPEFLARVRALHRRHRATAASLPIGTRRLVPVTRTVVDPTGRTADVSLSERECALLALLARAPHQIFTRSQLRELIFDRADKDSTVDTYVHYLRRKLGRDTVQTVRGLGYRLGAR